MRSRILPLLAAGAYLVAPGHADLPMAGVPLGVSGTVGVSMLVILTWWARADLSPRLAAHRAALVLAWLTALKVAVGLAAPASGWHGLYYASEGGDAFGTPVERSIDFLDLPGGRIDSRIDFEDAAFPVHFFNDRRFNYGFRREVTEPFSVRWRGVAHVDAARSFEVTADARGALLVLIDTTTVIDLRAPTAPGRARTDVTLDAGRHTIEVLYHKPRDTEGLARLSGAPPVTPFPVAQWRQSLALPLTVGGWLLHGFALVVCASWLAPAVGRQARTLPALFRRTPLDALDRTAALFVIAALVAQGCWKARHLIDRVWTLTGGDDWFAYEMLSREIVLNGVMLTEGKPIGHGAPYFYYPGYSYFLAIVHRLAGESLAGVIVVNFLMLALATVIVYRLARILVGQTAALLSLVWLLLIQQSAFTRYYTVTLLSENLFVLTVAATVFSLTLYVARERVHHLIWAAIAGGVSALTRPSILAFLPVAAVIVAVSSRRHRSAARALAVTALFGIVWMAAIAPATIRNYAVSGRPVLITAGQAGSFITHNLPPQNPERYGRAFKGTLLSVAQVLLQIAIEQPGAFLRNMFTKIGFALGMVHWLGSSVHPELLLTSSAYLAALLLVPESRALAALPLHGFVWTHLAALLLSNPSIYGYRLLMPMYLFLPICAAAVPLRFLKRRAG